MKAKLKDKQLTVVQIGHSSFYTLPIPGYEGYLATTCGNIISLVSGRTTANSTRFYDPKLLKGRDADGYLRVDLYKESIVKSERVHRLIAMAFFEEPEAVYEKGNEGSERCQVNHIDGNKKNNSVSNLEWCTPAENIKHYNEILKRAS